MIPYSPGQESDCIVLYTHIFFHGHQSIDRDWCRILIDFHKFYVAFFNDISRNVHPYDHPYDHPYFIELDDGKIYRKTLYNFDGKNTMVSGVKIFP